MNSLNSFSKLLVSAIILVSVSAACSPADQVEVIGENLSMATGGVDQLPEGTIVTTSSMGSICKVEMIGTVEAKNVDAWTIDGQNVLINGQTEMKDGIPMGGLVKIHAQVAADSTLTAQEIELVNRSDSHLGDVNQSDDDDDISFDGFDSSHLNYDDDDVFDDDSSTLNDVAFGDSDGSTLDDDDDDVYDDDSSILDDDDDAYDDDSSTLDDDDEGAYGDDDGSDLDDDDDDEVFDDDDSSISDDNDDAYDDEGSNDSDDDGMNDSGGGGSDDHKGQNDASHDDDDDDDQHDDDDDVFDDDQGAG